MNGAMYRQGQGIEMGRGWVLQHDKDQGNKGVAQEETH